MPINFDVSPTDLALIEQIAERAHTEIYKQGAVQSRMATVMDLCATHNTCPLDLGGLLRFSAYDFAHDVAGIRRHLNRTTGELEDCFSPRCSLPEPATTNDESIEV